MELAVWGLKTWKFLGVDGYLHALNGNALEERKKATATVVPLKAPAYSDNLKYLSDVLNGTIKADNDLSSLNNNMIVVRILEAARKSAKDGKRVVL